MVLGDYSHLIGGLSGGVVSTLVCHPLDFLRIRYAANCGSEVRPQYRSYIHAFRTIVQAEGIRGVYQGLWSSVLVAPLTWGLYFHTYHLLHDRFVTSDSLKDQSFSKNLLFAFLAGVPVSLITNPLWMIRTRLCLQYENSAKPYKGIVDCFQKVYANEGGVRGLYKGLTPGLFGSVGGAIQFSLYNYLKDKRCAMLKLPYDHKLSTADYLVFSCVSRVLSTILVYPYQVIRVRLQDHNFIYGGLTNCIRQTWKGEGLRGFYGGMLMAIVRQLPGTITTFVVYENCRYLFQ